MGDGILTDTIYYPNFMGVKDTLSEYSYDIKKSQQMLSQMGWKDINGDGVLEDKDGKRYILEVLTCKDNATRSSAAHIIKNNLELLGLKTEVISLPASEYIRAIRAKDFDILITGYTIEESYDLRSFFNGKNEWGYTNYGLSTKAAELDRLYTPQQYTEKYKELKDLLLDELPYYTLCYKKMSLIGTSTFEADKMPMFNNIYKNCDTWRWTLTEEKNNEDNE